MPKKATGTSKSKSVKTAKKAKTTKKTKATKATKAKKATKKAVAAKAVEASTEVKAAAAPKPAAAVERKKAPARAAATRVRIRQVRSGIGHAQTYRRTLEALGLRHHQHEVVLPDNPSVRGMLFKVRHLVRVTPEEA